jgi:uncharacterized protein (TIGR02246 family)
MPGTTALTTQPLAATADPAAVAGHLFDHMAEAWNRADGAGFAEVYEDDATFVNILGVEHRGVAAIAHGHQAIFDTIYAGSTVRYEVEDARLVAPGCVVANVAAVLHVPAGPFAGIRNARITGTIVRRDDRWAVAAFHNTLVEEAR